MIKKYRGIWKSTFKFNDSLSRYDYWIFTGVNTIFMFLVVLFMESFKLDSLGQLISLIFVFPQIAAGVRRMNDLGVSPGYFFIPLYGFYLCLLSGKKEHHSVAVIPKIDIKTFFIIVLISFIIGVINLVFMIFYNRGGGLAEAIVSLCIGLLLYPLLLTILLVLINLVIKEKATIKRIFFLWFSFANYIIDYNYTTNTP
ncbi:DUF805 domain-containing protein [Flavobacterium sp. PL002]|uniref:DUF805 domain-containing protein n=1 Tax=Flavobacterium sp. PL002 TaxID=1897058 RepID=UPI001788907A|nr:DUF805 domain-containing protein [Flavobacterium sp. PL002]MBE0392680.1 hypothetical protein [Flavobacterium sp. PL002]